MTIMNYFSKGGPIMGVLLALNVIGVSIIIWKTLALMKLGRGRGALVEELQATFGRMRPEYDDPKLFFEVVREEVNYFFARVENGIDKVKLIAAISPLLGLLGTVIGILSSFEAVSQSGFGDPSRFADGISVALVTTVGGLLVSIPHFVAYHVLTRWLDACQHETERALFATDLFKTSKRGATWEPAGSMRTGGPSGPAPQGAQA